MMRNTIARSARTANQLGRIALTLGVSLHGNADSRMAAEQIEANALTKTFGN